MDFYKTIADKAEASFIERKSEFIGYLCPTQSEEQAISFISEVRAKHRKATHNVYAYILREQNITRYSDDGEPQGTAGVPVLDILQKEGLYDICCVVTRYFGGIMLGAGGLVRAYSHGAKLAIESAQILHMRLCNTLRIEVEYNLYDRISHEFALPTLGVRVLDTVFTENVTITLLVSVDGCDALIKTLTEVTNGQISLDIINELYADLPL